MKTREQSRQLALVMLGELPLDVSLLVNQATLHDRVGNELQHRATKRIAVIENRKQPMLTGKAASYNPTHQFTRNFTPDRSGRTDKRSKKSAGPRQRTAAPAAAS